MQLVIALRGHENSVMCTQEWKSQDFSSVWLRGFIYEIKNMARFSSQRFCKLYLMKLNMILPSHEAITKDQCIFLSVVYFRMYSCIFHKNSFRWTLQLYSVCGHTGSSSSNATPSLVPFNVALFLCRSQFYLSLYDQTKRMRAFRVASCMIKI